MAFGCSGVDVPAWLAANRVRVQPDFFNYWLLWRTTRDNPTEQDIRDTVAAVFVKWFDGSVIDPVATFKGTTRSGVADLIEVVKIGAPGQALGVPGKGLRDMQRRELLPLGPPPMVAAAERADQPAAVQVLVRFAYRGKLGNMAWPTWRGGAVDTDAGRRCPVDADWILDRAWIAATEPAPPEQTTGEKAGEEIDKAAKKATRKIWSIALPLLALVAAGAAIVRKVTK